MRLFLLFFAICIDVAYANQYNIYDINGKNRGVFNGEINRSSISKFVQKYHGAILVNKKALYVNNLSRNINLAQICESSKKNHVTLNSLKKNNWIEVEKNEITQICLDNQVLAWETSLNSIILNDSCLAIQAPMLTRTETIKLFPLDTEDSIQINLAVGMKYLKFENEEVLLGYNKYNEKDFKPKYTCTTEDGYTIDCSPENNYPEKIVSINGKYLVDKYPVTNCDFIQIMWDSIPQKAIFENESIKSIQEDWISRKRAHKRNGICDAYDSAASMVTLYQAIKYANARSISEGLRPYYILTPSDADNEEILSNGYIIDNLDFTEHENENVQVTEDSTSDGYRLPNLDEWMIFARGGDKKKKAPWGDSSVAFEDVSKYAKFNTKIPQNEKEWTYSGIVGQLLPNGYGLYDIFGLVEEKVLLKRPLYGNLGNPSCLKGGYRVSTTKEGFFETSYPYWKWINYGYFQFGAPGIFSGFRLIRNIGNNAKWENVESGTK